MAQQHQSSHAALDPQALQTLYEIIGDSPEIMTELIDCYLAETPKLVQSMQEAASRQDPVALNRAAHMLKASSAYLGATTLASLCAQLEASSQAGIMTMSVATVQQLEAECERVQAALKQAF